MTSCEHYFNGCLMFHCINETCFIQPFPSYWTLSYFQVFFLVIKNINVTIFIDKSLSIFLIASLRQMLRNGISGSKGTPEANSHKICHTLFLYSQLVFIKHGNFTSSIYGPPRILSSLFHSSLHNHQDPSFFSCAPLSSWESCWTHCHTRKQSLAINLILKEAEY